MAASWSRGNLRSAAAIQGALAAASVAAVVSIAGRESVDRLLLISLGCFAAAIPLSLLAFVLMQSEARRAEQQVEATTRGRGHARLAEASQETAYSACFAGFLTLFWHFDGTVALVFGVSATLALVAGFATHGLDRPLGWLRKDS